LQFCEGLGILQRNRSLIGQGLNKMFVFACKFTVAFIENLEDADNLLFRSAEWDAENVTRMKPCERIDRWVKQRCLVRTLDYEEFACDEDGPGNTEAGIEPYGVRHTQGDFCPELPLVLVEDEYRRPFGIHVFGCLVGNQF